MQVRPSLAHEAPKSDGRAPSRLVTGLPELPPTGTPRLELLPGASQLLALAVPEVDPVLQLAMKTSPVCVPSSADGNAPTGHRVRDLLGREVRAVVEVVWLLPLRVGR